LSPPRLDSSDDPWDTLGAGISQPFAQYAELRRCLSAEEPHDERSGYGVVTGVPQVTWRYARIVGNSRENVLDRQVGTTVGPPVPSSSFVIFRPLLNFAKKRRRVKHADARNPRCEVRIFHQVEQVIVCRNTIAFCSNGRVAISYTVIPPEGDRTLSVSSTGQGARMRSLEVSEIKSAWR
jgi:hypothetical protein